MSQVKDAIGFYEEPTTYRHDFPIYPPQPVVKMIKEDRTGITTQMMETTIPLPERIESHDTFQRLDYKSRMPFNALWKPKEIVGTDPQQAFCKRTIIDHDLAEAIRTRPRAYMSPGISLDNVEDSETRRLMVDFTYTTTARRACKEAWLDFKPKNLCLPNTVFEKTVDPLAIRLQLIPDMPAGFQSAGSKWDKLQQRCSVDNASSSSKNRPQYIDYEERLAKLVTPEEKSKVKDLLRTDALRLPYDKMPLSYGGFRPVLALNVPSRKRSLPVTHPQLTVSQCITGRYADDPSI